MTLVNIDPHVILHQKTQVPRAVNFFESQKASQHPVYALQLISRKNDCKMNAKLHKLIKFQNFHSQNLAKIATLSTSV